MAAFSRLLRPLYQQSFYAGIIIRLVAGTAIRSPSSPRYFLHQHAQPPTKATDYDLVPFGKLVPISHGIPNFGGILDLAYRVDVLDDQTGSTQHGLFTIPGFHSQGLKDFKI